MRDILVQMIDLTDSLALSVRFTRLRAECDLVEVRRADGSVLSWEFPTHVSRLPHDLCHLVVEEGLGIGFGFWGLVSRGVDVRIVDDYAELALEGSPLREYPAMDFSDLLHSEEAVAVLSPSGLKTEPVGALVVVTLTSGVSASVLTQSEIDRVAALFPGITPDLVQSVRGPLVALDREWATAAVGADHVAISRRRRHQLTTGPLPGEEPRGLRAASVDSLS